MLSLNCQFYRYDGVKTDAGKTWTGQDSLRAEKDDVRGGWRDIERDDQLQWLPEYDAGKKKCNSETVSKHWVIQKMGGDPKLGHRRVRVKGRLSAQIIKELIGAGVINLYDATSDVYGLQLK